MELIEELWARPRWTQSSGEELANSISHGFGFVAAVVAAPWLLLPARQMGDRVFFAGIIVYLITLFVLYLGSTIYHAWPQTRVKCALQVLDHGAIFVLIAGTYTPFLLGPLRGAWAWLILALVWGAAVFGIALKMTHGVERYTKTAMALYLGMGWTMLFAIGPLLRHVPLAGIGWLIAGGIFYTAGVFFFIKERRRYCHFVWHLFVLSGTACHFLAVRACLA